MYFDRKGITIVPALLINAIKVKIQTYLGKSLKLSRYFFIIINYFWGKKYYYKSKNRFFFDHNNKEMLNYN